MGEGPKASWSLDHTSLLRSHPTSSLWPLKLLAMLPLGSPLGAWATPYSPDFPPTSLVTPSAAPLEALPPASPLGFGPGLFSAHFLQGP